MLRSHRPAKSALFFALILLTSTPAWTQPQPAPAGHNDPMQQHLFPPDLVMAHQGEIGLTTDQRQQLIDEVQALQVDLVPLQVEMSQSAERLAGLVAEARVDEAAALEVVDGITTLEARIKRRHMALLLRIKNLLSPEQQEQLQALRRH